jgi:SAM-dependent methyltransferase
MEKKYLSFPEYARQIPFWLRLLSAAFSFVMFAVSWLAAYLVKTPGLKIRFWLSISGLRLLCRKLEFKESYRQIVKPLDSVRYFEFSFMNDYYPVGAPLRQLDVSSPRYWLMLCAKKHDVHIDALNPDSKDLGQTIDLMAKVDLTNRFSFLPNLISDIPSNKEYDLITCMSVLEHIPNDQKAVQTMWDALRPGGVLMLTVPCARHTYEEYTTVDEYQLLEKDRKGYVFWQRFYDEKELQERIFSVTGVPRVKAVYGEKKLGLYDKNVWDKRTNPMYPFWNEPFWTGRSFEIKDHIDQLKGMGVIGMVFHKANAEGV